MEQLIMLIIFGLIIATLATASWPLLLVILVIMIAGSGGKKGRR